MMASIEMLLGQQILDMAYFCHCHYHGHLLSIMKIYNPGGTCCYARPASVILNSNAGLKCWPYFLFQLVVDKGLIWLVWTPSCIHFSY